LPVIIIKENHKDRYYQLLADVQVYGGDIELLTAFFGERINESQELVLKAIKGEDLEEPDDVDKEIELWKRNQLLNRHSDKIKRSNSVVSELYNNGLENLLREFNKCHNGFFEMFNSKEVNFYQDNSRIPVKNLEYLSQLVSNPNHSSLAIDYNDDRFRQFSCFVQLSEYLMGNNSFSINSELVVYFNLQDYSIEYEGMYFSKKVNKTAKNYHEHISNDEIKILLKEVKKDLLDRVKSETESFNKP
jgi:hypothetical protein